MMTKREIVYRDPKLLSAYEFNARTHSPEQITLLRRSIREFGFNNPILLKDDGKTIGAGHARCLAAIAEGIETVPTILLTDLTETQWRAYVLVDNQLALTGTGWDDELLAKELKALSEMDFDIPMIGFSEAELHKLMGLGDGATDPDAEAPEPPEDPVSAAGDIWLLGGHRIVCGSSTDPETVAALLRDDKPLLMVTDPPYGVEYDASWRNESGLNRKGAAVGKVLNDDNADWREAWALFPGDVAYVWHAGLFAGVVADSLAACGFELRSQIIWRKSQLVIGRSDYHWIHEPCWYAVRKGKKGHWAGDRKQSTVWDIAKPHKSESGHSTQKPIECMKHPIENNSKVGDLVYEPFSGSGTTILAGQISGRKVRAVELNPAYVDVAVLRWQEFTGDAAVLEETGQTFAEVKAERVPEVEAAE